MFFRIGLESDLYIHMYTISHNLKEASLAVAHMLEIMLGPSRDAHYDLASGPFPLVSLAWL